MKLWKSGWEESRQRYLDWWSGKGLVISMWEHLRKEGPAHEEVPAPPPPADISQFWFDPEWRAAYLHHQLSVSSFKADILPVANTHLGPGSLAACLGARLEGREDTIWIREDAEPGEVISWTEENPWWKLHLDLLKACRRLSEDRYFVGCPDLVEGLDTLAALKGTDRVLMEMITDPELLERQLQQVNDIWYRAFSCIYDIIRVGDEMAFCYFSLWAPGKVSKLQSDISLMISPEDFRRFVQPYIREQAAKLDYSLYHLDGVGALRHLDAILEIEALKAVQWTPGVGEPQGGDPRWYALYRKILESGKSVMPCWVEPGELKPLLDHVGAEGVHVLMHFKSEKEIEETVKIAASYRK